MQGRPSFANCTEGACKHGPSNCKSPQSSTSMLHWWLRDKHGQWMDWRFDKMLSWTLKNMCLCCAYLPMQVCRLDNHTVHKSYTCTYTYGHLIYTCLFVYIHVYMSIYIYIHGMCPCRYILSCGATTFAAQGGKPEYSCGCQLIMERVCNHAGPSRVVRLPFNPQEIWKGRTSSKQVTVWQTGGWDCTVVMFA